VNGSAPFEKSQTEKENAVLLLVENNDSFSFNVRALFDNVKLPVRMVSGAVAHQHLEEADVVVVGPGPTDPIRANLVGLVQETARCLGHQALGLAFGARLIRATPHHGKTDTITFQGSRFFSAFATPQTVMRYHSLTLSEITAPLTTTATTLGGTVMAVEHDTLPMAGLQFHPDSYATENGQAMVDAFLKQVLK
jgi:anthranilate synthase component II